MLWISLGLLAACAATPRLVLEPPLDPVAGTFAAVAYWDGASPPDAVTFTLKSPEGKTVWETTAPFLLPLSRASARCDTSPLPDGTHTLSVEAGGERAETPLRLRQGRETLPETRPFRNRMLWMPMTGWTDEQLDDALAAGYDTVFTKLAPAYAGPGKSLDFSHADEIIRKAQGRDMKVVTAWLLWAGLPPGAFHLECRDGRLVPNRIDPCDDEAMAHVRLYAEQLLDHYMGCGDVIGIAPTWGIYGEAGYAEFDGGYSPHALRQFNRWLVARGEQQAARLPDPGDGYTELLWHRFRFEYMAQVWGELNGHLRRLNPNGTATGAWQEIYNGHMYSLALSEAPGADFAVNEMCFPWGSTQDQPRAIGETMGIRYKCGGFEDYRDYYLPLIARKWAEGQQAIGCQLSVEYAESAYTAWPEGRARELEFDRWEDLFAPHIRRVRDTPVVEEPAEVAYIQMTYPASIYPDAGNTVTDINLHEIVLRMLGVQYERIPIQRLHRLRAADLARFKVILLPGAWYLDDAMWRLLRDSGAALVLTGGVMQAGDGGMIPDGGSRSLDGMTLAYGAVPGGAVTVAPECPPEMAADLDSALRDGGGDLSPDLGLSAVGGAETLLRVGEAPLLARRGNLWIVTNRLLFACAHDPDRVPPDLGGSSDVSANEGDPWGTASSSSPMNAFGTLLIRNVLEACGVFVRIREPLPRRFSPWLGDHVERVNVTHSIVANNDDKPLTVDIRCRRPVVNHPCHPGPSGGHVARVTVPAYDFVSLEYTEPVDRKSGSSPE